MAAVVSEIGAALLARLEAVQATLSLPFVPKYDYAPSYSASDLTGNPFVTVVPKSHTIEAFTRGAKDESVTVDIAIQRHIESTPAAVIDNYVMLTQDIHDLFYGVHLDEIVSADVRCVRIDHDPICSVQHLDQHRIFTSVLTLTFRTMR